MFPQNISKNFDRVKKIAFSDLPIEEKMRLFDEFDEIETFYKNGVKSVKNCFLPIEGFDDYAVNPFGYVISCNSIYGKIIARLLSIYKGDKGNYCVSLSREGRKINKRIHILVAETFLQNYEDKNPLDHIDGNKENNRLDNLEFCAEKRLSVDKINQISAMIDAGESSRKIAKKLNISHMAVSRVRIAKEYGLNPLEFDIPLQTNKPKRVKCLENGKIYASYADAEKDLGVRAKDFAKYFTRVAVGWDTDFYGYHFERV